jgi:hypothetical protein
VFGYLLFVLVFLGLGHYLFTKTDFASYLLILAALSSVSALSETRRNEFLKCCFPDNVFYQIRLIENLLIALPFALFLCYKSAFIQTFACILLPLLLARFNFSRDINITIPTPFYRKPFEFTVGFRNSIGGLIVAIALAVIAVSVSNFNLGVFALLLVFFIAGTYHYYPENEFFVWSYSMTSKRFLFEKIKTAFLFSTMLALPVTLILGFFFFEEIHGLLIFQGFGYLFVLTVILAKYSTYPSEINIPQVVSIGLCVYFPPTLFALIPYFYSQSVKRLNEILE